MPTRPSPRPAAPVLLTLPFTGRWRAINSPARRVPSHGTELWGERFAIDFVAVDERGRSAPRGRPWGTEPATRFVGFGRPVLAPADGLVVAVHDAEPDHEAHRSPIALIRYAAGQRTRLREGVGAVAGNHLVLALPGQAGFVALVHLRAGSLRVRPGAVVATGQVLAECGNSGNSTEPHVHVQVMDDPDPRRAGGLPVAFRRFREWPRRGRPAVDHEAGLPGEGAVVSPLPG